MPSSRSTALPLRALLAALAAVLIAAIGLVIYGETRPLERTFYGSVKDLLPKPEEMPGWTVQYLPIAETPEEMEKVEDILRYDEAVYALYTHATDHIAVYIAYWKPGKTSPRLIAGHTPDVCWVNRGWTPAPRYITTDELPARSGRGVGEQWRTLIQNGAIVYLAFRHSVGAEDVIYNSSGRPRWYAAVVDMARWGVQQRQEQLFVRVSSSMAPVRWPRPMASLVQKRHIANRH